MNCDEFSREFDILWNNATSNQSPSLNSYEKSVFLTQAQEAVVIDLYKGNSNKPFDLTEEVASYLSPIIREMEISSFDIVDGSMIENIAKHYNMAMMSAIDNNINDCWFIVYESALVSSVNSDCEENIFHCEVIPTTYDTFLRKQRNPFKKPNNHRVLRLNVSDDHHNNGKRCLYFIYPNKSKIVSYHCTYIIRPKPIILEDLTEAYGNEYDLSINGISTKSECELSNAIHREILYKAVDLAKITWTSTIINSTDNNK